ncbi:ATP12 family chaperone protein [Pseudoroseicyclus aestuarii]|uniref:Chaperone required for assembly of F1-ATPase n=1 Tax=Pseudoroseicyclus aestuarii TaxID=1795041 RepID=A0A318STH1_9RHOB|nr:ATP12 family protein [Pseudoroseicyclus aestuarii]PYE84943.1 chaperone required for assembly of F1-ATPase [Pseudoroseicyclus aestuarii]
MAEWAPKRFWTEAKVVEAEGGWTVVLDGRGVRTPAKAPLVLPSEATAALVAEEWQAQGERIEPATMPATRTANSAIDRVAPQHGAVAEMLAGYGETDLLCYRAEAPEGLVQRQTEAWDPLLEWSAQALGARLQLAQGLMPVAQDAGALRALAARVEAMDSFRLAAFHDLVALSGSLVLAFAVTEQRLTPSQAWELSRVDEDWQIAQWGDDEEAAATTAYRRAAFLDAARFYLLID